MTFASLFAVESAPRPRGRGRRPARSCPEAREKHINVAWDLLFKEDTWPVVAERHDISCSSVYLFTKRALGYDDPRSVVLRQIARDRLPGRN